jgi:divalent metal cation (Fe/Co/Zn/Cd) transporter
MGSADDARVDAARRGQRLTWATLAYNSLEGLISIAAGVMAGSVALVGFGLDSCIELTASGAAIWRLRADATPARREFAEQRALRLIGWSFFALAAYVVVEAVRTLGSRTAPDTSRAGMAIAAASLVVMPLLARAKRRVAAVLNSRAIRAEARQTDICVLLSAVVLSGLVLNSLLGWWWADPVAALVMVPLIVGEGRDALSGHSCGCLSSSQFTSDNSQL